MKVATTRLFSLQLDVQLSVQLGVDDTRAVVIEKSRSRAIEA